MNEVLVRVEFDNIVVKISNPMVAEQIKLLVIGRKPKAKGGWKKHTWSDDDHEYLVHALQEGRSEGESNQSIFKKISVVLGVTSNAVAARAHKYHLTRNGAGANKTIEEFNI